MNRLPFFIEVWESGNNADLRMCHKVMTHLFKQRITPLPFATTVREVADVTGALERQLKEPALFIVNTFWAEETLPQIDPYMGETPVLFFRRELFTSRELLGQDAHRGQTMHTISTMTPRETSVWSYGAKTSESIAERAAVAVMKFLQDGNFRNIERMNPSKPAGVGVR
jgi:hypothetical protein